MAIPGLKPNYDVRAKVRIGEKKQTSSGKEYPSSTDYFICDDTEFVQLCGPKPKEIRIVLPFEKPADAFSTGLELWRGELLACYTKNEGDPPIAYRRTKIRQGGQDIDFLKGETIRGEPMGRGKERTPITCRHRECPLFKTSDKSKACRPMGRLQFFLEGGSNEQVFQLDTKSWNSIEKIEATLSSAATRGDLRGRVFILSVAIEQKANQKFPVLSLKEADVQVNNENDVAIADALIQLRKALEVGDEGVCREKLVDALNLTNPGWRGNEAFIARIKEVGIGAASKGLLEKFEL